VDLTSPIRIPSWVPRVPNRVAVGWGFAYAIWAFFKVVDGFVPKMQCGPPPPMSILSGQVALFEIAVGVATAGEIARRWASLVGVTLNLCFVGFAFGADARHLPWEECGCFFAGIHMPWLPWHAIAGGVLALPFLAIFLDAERGRARMFGSRRG
jgi:hypothetical protein